MFRKQNEPRNPRKKEGGPRARGGTMIKTTLVSLNKKATTYEEGGGRRLISIESGYHRGVDSPGEDAGLRNGEKRVPRKRRRMGYGQRDSGQKGTRIRANNEKEGNGPGGGKRGQRA